MYNPSDPPPSCFLPALLFIQIWWRLQPGTPAVTEAEQHLHIDFLLSSIALLPPPQPISYSSLAAGIRCYDGMGWTSQANGTTTRTVPLRQWTKLYVEAGARCLWSLIILMDNESWRFYGTKEKDLTCLLFISSSVAPKAVILSVYFLSFTSNDFSRRQTPADVRDEDRAPIGCRLSPMRPPHWGTDNLRVWWMRGSVCVCVCVWVSRGGHRSEEGPCGLALQSNEPFQERKGARPHRPVRCFTHTHQKKGKGLNMMTTSPRRGRTRHLLSNVSVWNNNTVKPLEEESNTKSHTCTRTHSQANGTIMCNGSC